MTDAALLIAQIAVTGGLCLWMVTGALDNWLYPDLNRQAVAQVMAMEAMARDFPEDFAHVAHRRVTDARIVGALFLALVLAETVAAAIMLVGTVMLAGALLGLADPEAARAVSILGVAGFVAIWAAFLGGGNWFAYYYCHGPAQATHFALAIWGTAGLVLLAL